MRTGAVNPRATKRQAIEADVAVSGLVQPCCCWPARLLVPAVVSQRAVQCQRAAREYCDCPLRPTAHPPEVLCALSRPAWVGRDQVGEKSAIESPGIFGRSVRGRVQASYSVEGQAPPKAHHVPDTPVTSPDDTLGVGLSDAPFVVEVPDVRGGVYWITFDFSVPFGISIRVDSKTLGAGTYRMCVPIRVTSR